MTSCSRNFDSLSWTKASEAASNQGSTLIWPFGACEQHGPHLPLATDTIFADRIVSAVLQRLPNSFPIWRLSNQALGFSPEHSSFPGTISLSSSLLLQLVMEVGTQVAGFGFRRLVLFNAHGGQIGLLETAARQLRIQSPSMAVLPCFLWRGVSSLNELIPKHEKEYGLHAGLAETSLMMAISEELVGLERPSEGIENSIEKPPEGWSLEGAAPCAWLAKDLTKTGVIGDTRQSNLDLGKSLEKALIDHWVSLFTNLMESNWPPVG